MHGHPRRRDDSLGVALVLYLGLYCAIAGGLAFGVYEWMQPSRRDNPGVAAYKAPPATVLGYAPASRHAEVAVATPPAAEPEPETVAAAAPPPSPPSEAQKPDAEAKKPAAEGQQAKTERQKRQHQARRGEGRDPMMS